MVIEMKTLLVAADSSYLREALTEDLARHYRVITCPDGISALETVSALQPDVAVIDLALRKLDGIDLLREISAMGLQPEVIVIAGFTSEPICRTLENLKVRHIFRVPASYDCMIGYLAGLAVDSLNGTDYAGILARLGFNMATDGSRIVLTALKCYAENPGQKLTMQLYPQVAQLCGTTWQQVEKAIRSAIDTAWGKHRQQWLAYFPAGKNGRPLRPTNGAFLSRITMQVNQAEYRSVVEV